MIEVVPKIHKEIKVGSGESHNALPVITNTEQFAAFIFFHKCFDEIRSLGVNILIFIDQDVIENIFEQTVLRM